MEKSCLACLHKAVCLKRSLALFELFIVTGRYGEVEDAKANLDVSVDCKNFEPRGDTDAR